MPSKICSLCGVIKTLDDFNKSERTADKRRSECKACHRSYQRKYNKSAEVKTRDADRQRRMRSERGPECRSAHCAVARAIKSGMLIRPDHCSVCLLHGAPQAHHDDHSKKLDVMWLCPICHAVRHAELKKARDAKSF